MRAALSTAIALTLVACGGEPEHTTTAESEPASGSEAAPSEAALPPVQVPPGLITYPAPDRPCGDASGAWAIVSRWTDFDGSVIENGWRYTYDASARRLEGHETHGDVVRWTLDESGRVSRYEHDVGGDGRLDRVVTYERTSDQTRAVTDDAVDGRPDAITVTTHPEGGVERVATDQDADGEDDVVLVTTRDAQGRLASSVLESRGAVVARGACAYTAAARRRPASVTCEDDDDADGRIDRRSVTRLDDAGRVTSVEDDVDADGFAEQEVRYTWRDGRLSEETRERRRQGETPSADDRSRTVLEYDAEGRLTLERSLDVTTRTWARSRTPTPAAAPDARARDATLPSEGMVLLPSCPQPSEHRR